MFVDHRRIKGRKRMVAIALALAGITAAISSVVFTLYLGYETGAYNFRHLSSARTRAFSITGSADANP